MPSWESASETAKIARKLARRFQLSVIQVEWLPAGQGTVNYRAIGPSGTVFVKRYLPKTNLDAERKAIQLTKVAAAAGVPTAPLISTVNGELIDTSLGAPISVWSWVDGVVLKTGLGRRHYQEIGRTLARIHRAFARLPENALPAEKTEKFRSISVPAIRTDIAHLKNVISRRIQDGVSDEFDVSALHELSEREQQLDRLTQILSSLPSLTSQIIHGDYTTLNVLFNRTRLVAVLDFRPPTPFLIAYELGRVAFNPDIVVQGKGWIRAARELVESYVAENQAVNPKDIEYCGRVALLQLMKSLYGVKQHYQNSGLIQSELDRFWVSRHRAVSTMLDHLSEIDETLRAAARLVGSASHS